MSTNLSASSPLVPRGAQSFERSSNVRTSNNASGSPLILSESSVRRPAVSAPLSNLRGGGGGGYQQPDQAIKPKKVRRSPTSSNNTDQGGDADDSSESEKSVWTESDLAKSWSESIEASTVQDKVRHIQGTAGSTFGVTDTRRTESRPGSLFPFRRDVDQSLQRLFRSSERSETRVAETKEREKSNTIPCQEALRRMEVLMAEAAKYHKKNNSVILQQKLFDQMSGTYGPGMNPRLHSTKIVRRQLAAQQRTEATRAAAQERHNRQQQQIHAEEQQIAERRRLSPEPLVSFNSSKCDSQNGLTHGLSDSGLTSFNSGPFGSPPTHHFERNTSPACTPPVLHINPLSTLQEDTRQQAWTNFSSSANDRDSPGVSSPQSPPRMSPLVAGGFGPEPTYLGEEKVLNRMALSASSDEGGFLDAVDEEPGLAMLSSTKNNDSPISPRAAVTTPPPIPEHLLISPDPRAALPTEILFDALVEVLLLDLRIIFIRNPAQGFRLSRKFFGEIRLWEL